VLIDFIIFISVVNIIFVLFSCFCMLKLSIEAKALDEAFSTEKYLIRAKKRIKTIFKFSFFATVLFWLIALIVAIIILPLG